MSLRKRILLAGLIVLPGAVVAAPAPMLELDATGEVQIAPDGHVSDYRLGSELAPEIRTLVDRNVRQWRFQPVLVDGHAVVAKTAMTIHLQALPSGEKDRYSLRIAHIEFGQPRVIQPLKPPHYPEEAVAAHLGAKVILAMRLDETGKVVEVTPYQTSLDARPSSDIEAERWRHRFEKAAIAAAKDWRYDLSETVNGKPIGIHVLAPIAFSFADPHAPKADPNAWKAYLPGPVHPAPWMPAGTLAAGGDPAALGDNQALSLDSRFHLQDDVVGKAL